MSIKRCEAFKNDGVPCANPVKPAGTRSCGVPAHQARVAEKIRIEALMDPTLSTPTKPRSLIAAGSPGSASSHRVTRAFIPSAATPGSRSKRPSQLTPTPKASTERRSTPRRRRAPTPVTSEEEEEEDEAKAEEEEEKVAPKPRKPKPSQSDRQLQDRIEGLEHLLQGLRVDVRRGVERRRSLVEDVISNLEEEVKDLV